MPPSHWEKLLRFRAQSLCAGALLATTPSHVGSMTPGKIDRNEENVQPMSDNGSGSNTGVIAVLVIFLVIVMAGLLILGGRIFSGNKRIDVNISTPK